MLTPGDRSTIEHAANLILERGLAKREYEDVHGQLCVIGALWMSKRGKVPGSSTDRFACLKMYQIENAVEHGLNNNLATLTKWNDDVMRTTDEVVALLRKVARDASSV